MKTITIEQWDHADIRQRSQWLADNIFLDIEGMKILEIRLKNGYQERLKKKKYKLCCRCRKKAARKYSDYCYKCDIDVYEEIQSFMTQV